MLHWPSFDFVLSRLVPGSSCPCLCFVRLCLVLSCLVLSLPVSYLDSPLASLSRFRLVLALCRFRLLLALVFGLPSLCLAFSYRSALSCLVLSLLCLVPCLGFVFVPVALSVFLAASLSSLVFP